MSAIRASIAMAVCNGEKYIREQIDSILNMMKENDELVISYDESKDCTLEIIMEYEKKDNRVKVVFDKGKSVESNFNNAVLNCNGKYIFLADQDDVWINDKINRMVLHFEKHPKTKVLISDGYLSNKELNPFDEIFRFYSTSASAIRNYIKGSYLGCQMAFTSDIKDKVWPVCVDPPLPHDLWLGILGSRYGKVELMDEKLIHHRIHDSNFTHTSKMRFVNVIKNRMFLLYQLVCRMWDNKRKV